MFKHRLCVDKVEVMLGNIFPAYLLNNPGMLWCAPGGAQVEGLCLRFNHAV